MHTQSLFYPASGYDTQVVFNLFPNIDEYWFVDYKCKNLSVNKMAIEKLFPKSLTPFISVDKDSLIENVTDVKLPSRKNINQLMKYSYTCQRNDNSSFIVHFVAGDGPAAFYQYFLGSSRKMDVFFYRKDGMGGGGSGISWFKKKLFRMVLSALIWDDTQGLLVTDGSNYSDFPRLSIHSLNATFSFKQYKVEFLKRNNEGFINYWLVENTDFIMINKKYSLKICEEIT